MFTGLIEAVCTVRSVRRTADAMQIEIDLGRLADQANIGDSITINGVCLTVVRLDGSCAAFDVSGETLSKAALSSLKTSAKVNVELAMKAGDRFGGHFVQGHIDGIATIKAVKNKGQFCDISFSLPPDLLSSIVPKGSIAVDGISLTIKSIAQDGFEVAIIPQTLKNTTLGNAKAGDKVNIETDIIVKTIARQLRNLLPKDQGLTVEKLKELGF